MSLFKRKKPWVTLQYEEQFIPENYSETGVESGESSLSRASRLTPERLDDE